MKVLLATLAVAAMMLSTSACNPCKPGESRCTGSVVEICRPDKKWSKVQDCSKLKRTDKKFKCCCRADTKSKKTKCACHPEK